MLWWFSTTCVLILHCRLWLLCKCEYQNEKGRMLFTLCVSKIFSNTMDKKLIVSVARLCRVEEMWKRRTNAETTCQHCLYSHCQKVCALKQGLKFGLSNRLLGSEIYQNTNDLHYVQPLNTSQYLTGCSCYAFYCFYNIKSGLKSHIHNYTYVKKNPEYCVEIPGIWSSLRQSLRVSASEWAHMTSLQRECKQVCSSIWDISVPWEDIFVVMFYCRVSWCCVHT